jgi:hypothetical protein
MLTVERPGIVVEMAVNMRKWPFPLGSGIFSRRLENDF